MLAGAGELHWCVRVGSMIKPPFNYCGSNVQGDSLNSYDPVCTVVKYRQPQTGSEAEMTRLDDVISHARASHAHAASLTNEERNSVPRDHRGPG